MIRMTLNNIGSFASINGHGIGYAQKHIHNYILSISLWILVKTIFCDTEMLRVHSDAIIDWREKFICLSDRLLFFFFNYKISTEWLNIFSVNPWKSPTEFIDCQIANYRTCPYGCRDYSKGAFSILSQRMISCKSPMSDIRIYNRTDLLSREKYYLCKKALSQCRIFIVFLMSILELRHIVKTYPNGTYPKMVLDNISCELRNFGVIGLLGKNGAGKSTLIKCCTGLVDYEGDILYKGVNLKSIQKKKAGPNYYSALSR